MLFRFLVCLCCRGPAAQMEGFVLFLLKNKIKKRARSCVASATERQQFVIGKLAISPWVAPSQIHFPTLLGGSSNAFPPPTMGVGLHRGTAVLICCVKKLAPGIVGKLFSLRVNF